MGGGRPVGRTGLHPGGGPSFPCFDRPGCGFAHSLALRVKAGKTVGVEIDMRAGVLAWGLVFISAAIGGFTNIETLAPQEAPNVSLTHPHESMPVARVFAPPAP